MSKNFKALGKGLSALLSDDVMIEENETSKPVLEITENKLLVDINLLKANKYQPRKEFDTAALNELAESIKLKGVLLPIMVRTSDPGYYEIVAGERRFRASKLAGLTEVPVIIRDFDDKEMLEIAIIENVQRKDLNVVEEAEGYKRLMDEFAYTQEDLAKIIGKSRSHIANLLRILSLPEDIKDLIVSGHLTMGHARALIGSDNASEIASKIVDEQLSVRETEDLVRGGSNKKEPKSPTAPKAFKKLDLNKDQDLAEIEQLISSNLGLPVQIAEEGNGGKLSIYFRDLNELDKLLAKLSA